MKQGKFNSALPSAPFAFSVCLASVLPGCQLWAFPWAGYRARKPCFPGTSYASAHLLASSKAPPNIWLTTPRLYWRWAERNKEKFPGPPCVTVPCWLIPHYASLTIMIELAINNHKGKLIPAWINLMTRALNKEKLKQKSVVDKEEWFL